MASMIGYFRFISRLGISSFKNCSQDKDYMNKQLLTLALEIRVTSDVCEYNLFKII